MCQILLASLNQQTESGAWDQDMLAVTVCEPPVHFLKGLTLKV